MCGSEPRWHRASAAPLRLRRQGARVGYTPERRRGTTFLDCELADNNTATNPTPIVPRRLVFSWLGITYIHSVSQVGRRGKITRSYAPAQPVRDFTVNRPSGQAVVTGVFPSPRHMPSFLSRMAFGIPALYARRCS